MSIIRKLFGLPVIFLIGVPVLIAIIWTAGITKAVLTPEFYVNIPQKILDEGPKLFDELLLELDDDIRVSDPNTKEWIKAFSKNKTNMSELIEQSGIKTWLKDEVVYKVSLIGKMMRGEIPIQKLRLDMTPLKKALQHPAIKSYILETLNHLPQCNQSQLEKWADALDFSKDIFDLPACRPVEPEAAILGLHMFDFNEIDEIPDDVPMVEGIDDGDLHFLPVKINIFKLTMFFVYMLLLLPFGIIFVGALITGNKSRWFGIGLSISALLSYLLAKLSFGLTEWISFAFQQEHYLTAFEEIAIHKVFSFCSIVLNPFLTNIETLSGFIFLAGLAFFAFSFYHKDHAPLAQPKKPTPPASPSQSQQKPVEETKVQDEEVEKE